MKCCERDESLGLIRLFIVGERRQRRLEPKREREREREEEREKEREKKKIRKKKKRISFRRLGRRHHLNSPAKWRLGPFCSIYQSIVSIQFTILINESI